MDVRDRDLEAVVITEVVAEDELVAPGEAERSQGKVRRARGLGRLLVVRTVTSGCVTCPSSVSSAYVRPVPIALQRRSPSCSAH